MYGLRAPLSPGWSGYAGCLDSQHTHSNPASIIVLLFVFEQIDCDGQHFAHHRHQGGALLEAALDQSTIVGAKGRALQMNSPQSGQIECLPQQPTAAFGELGLALPQAAFFDLDIQAGIGNHLVSARHPRSTSPSPARNTATVLVRYSGICSKALTALASPSMCSTAAC